MAGAAARRVAPGRGIPRGHVAQHHAGVLLVVAAPVVRGDQATALGAGEFGEPQAHAAHDAAHRAGGREHHPVVALLAQQIRQDAHHLRGGGAVAAGEVANLGDRFPGHGAGTGLAGDDHLDRPGEVLLEIQRPLAAIPVAGRPGQGAVRVAQADQQRQVAAHAGAVLPPEGGADEGFQFPAVRGERTGKAHFWRRVRTTMQRPGQPGVGQVISNLMKVLHKSFCLTTVAGASFNVHWRLDVCGMPDQSA